MQNSTTLTPWYKQRWPWILIALPLSAIIASFATLFIAMDKPDGLVADDYYTRMVSGINRTLENEQRAFDLKLSAQGQINLDAKLVTLSLSGEQDATLLQLTLLHPTQASQDRRIPLARQPDGRYLGTLADLASANWYVRLEPQGQHWRLNGRLDWPAQQHWQLTAIQP